MNFNWLLIFIIVFLVVIPSISDLGDYRVALAEDIRDGKLILTDKAKTMIENGDKFLATASSDGKGIISTNAQGEMDLYKAFVAKVWFERARLEMELGK